MLNRRRNLLETRNGRFLTFSILYISEGIPYGFTSVAMVAFMRQQGLPLDQIGAFVAALYLPWAFKWAWAPLVDLIVKGYLRLGARICGAPAWDPDFNVADTRVSLWVLMAVGIVLLLAWWFVQRGAPKGREA